MKIYILTLILAFTTSLAIGQEPDISNKDITWKCTNVKDKISGNLVVQNSEFITKANSISWVQKEFKQDFKITGREWNWQNGRGSIIYQVEYYDIKGEVSIEADASGTTITIKLDGGAEKYALAVSNYLY